MPPNWRNMEKLSILLHLFLLGCVAVNCHVVKQDGQTKDDNFLNVHQDKPHQIDTRNAIRGENFRWPNRTIPYVWAAYYNDETDWLTVRQAMDEWQKYTCIVFKRRDVEHNYLSIERDFDGCKTDVGMRGWGEHRFHVYSQCMNHNGILHELAHVIGLEHEQVRPDRDDYVEVLWNDIDPHNKHYFEKLSEWRVDTMGVSYDYMSVTHYPQNRYAKYDKIALKTKDTRYQEIIGHSEGLGWGDIQLVNKMYKCNEHCPNKTCPDSGFLGKDCKCWCFTKKIYDKVCECGTEGCEEFGGDPVCREKYEACSIWAAMGECDQRLEFMTKNCPIACGLCNISQ